MLQPELHYSYDLYRGSAGMEAMSENALQGATYATYDMESWEPRIGVFNVPFTFNVPEEVLAFVETPQWKGVEQDMENRGTKMLVAGYNFWTMEFYSTYPVSTMEDMAGHTLRVLPGATMQRMGELLGMKTNSISTSELPVALSTGMVDCMIGGGGKGYVTSLGIGDTMSYYLRNEFNWYPSFITFSTEWWNSLPDDVRMAAESVLPEWKEFALEFAYANEDEYFEWLPTILTPQALSLAEMDKMRATLAPINEMVAPRISWDLITAAQDIRSQGLTETSHFKYPLVTE